VKAKVHVRNIAANQLTKITEKVAPAGTWIHVGKAKRIQQSSSGFPEKLVSARVFQLTETD